MEMGIVELLRLCWIAAISPIIIASLPCFSSLHGLILHFAKRGKILQQPSSSSSSQRFTVPQKFFGHFYVVGVVWTTLLFLTTSSYAYKMVPMASEPFSLSTLASNLIGASRISSFRKTSLTHVDHRYKVWQSVFLLLLMEAHVIRRLIETIYVFKYSPSARMHIFGYLAGLFFYTAAPLSLCSNIAPEVFNFAVNQVVEFIVKGKQGMSTIEFDFSESVIPLSRLGWRSWIGTAIFLWGWIHQHRCHAILGSLREHKDQVDKYVVPRGDWFELVSSPHYLAEIVLYFGLLIASGGQDLTIWLLFVFVVTNLTIAAVETHKWYLSKFEDYPRNRHYTKIVTLLVKTVNYGEQQQEKIFEAALKGKTELIASKFNLRVKDFDGPNQGCQTARSRNALYEPITSFSLQASAVGELAQALS
ncbi:hypothetical protein ACFE04_001068 [Oxalis oulophora]